MGQAFRIAKEYLMIPDMDPHWWKAAEVHVYWPKERVVSLARSVKVGGESTVCRRHHGIDVSPRGKRSPVEADPVGDG
jgi:hypothetical protein